MLQYAGGQCRPLWLILMFHFYVTAQQSWWEVALAVHVSHIKLPGLLASTQKLAVPACKQDVQLHALHAILLLLRLHAPDMPYEDEQLQVPRRGRPVSLQKLLEVVHFSLCYCAFLHSITTDCNGSFPRLRMHGFLHG
jgi:hypothetical protein